MITRFSFFIILLSLFYYYCKKDSEIQPGNPVDNILLEVPVENPPSLKYDVQEDNALFSDSSFQYISAEYQYLPHGQILVGSIP